MAAACIKSSFSPAGLSFQPSRRAGQKGPARSAIAQYHVTSVRVRQGVTRPKSSTVGGAGILGLGAAGGLRVASEDIAKFKCSGRRDCSAARISATLPFLPPAFGYVALTAAASLLLLQWQMFQVAGQRRKAGVAYPAMYEDKEDSAFNCYQRAHQNTLESYPAFLTFLLLAGLSYPITASGLGAVWILGRLLYSLGYYTGNPNNRHRGTFHWFGLWGLMITSVVFGVKQLRWVSA